MKNYDCIIIGSGAAGYNAADSLFSFGVKNIALITENRLSGTSRNTGSDKQTYYKISLCSPEKDSVYDMAESYLGGGSMDGDVALTESANSARCFYKLIELGVDFPENEYGEFVGYKTDHDPKRRATSVGPYTSKLMTEALERAVQKKGVEIIEGRRAVKLAVKDNAVAGIIALDIKSGAFEKYAADSVILATGGPAGVYENSVYPHCHTGSSSLAAEAGASFSNLGEWQYGIASEGFRWNLSGTYQQALPRYVSAGNDGEREFLGGYMQNVQDNVFLKGYQWPFSAEKIDGSSAVDLAVFNEIYGKKRTVSMDFTRNSYCGEEGLSEEAKSYLSKSGFKGATPYERLVSVNPEAAEVYRKNGLDLQRDKIPVNVCAQHCNGGVEIDCNYMSSVAGLYAAGEAAGVFGVQRPGGSALNSCMVSSMRAARHISLRKRHAFSVGEKEKILAGALAETENFAAGLKHGGIKNFRGECRKFFSENFSFVRDIGKMEKGVKILKSRLRLYPEENGAADLLSAFVDYDMLIMQNMIAAAMLYSARRAGSRGSCVAIEGGAIVGENTVCRKKVFQTRLIGGVGGDIICSERPVRPVPDADEWFESVWRKHKELKGEKL